MLHYALIVALTSVWPKQRVLFFSCCLKVRNSMTLSRTSVKNVINLVFRCCVLAFSLCLWSKSTQITLDMFVMKPSFELMTQQVIPHLSRYLLLHAEVLLQHNNPVWLILLYVIWSVQVLLIASLETLNSTVPFKRIYNTHHNLLVKPGQVWFQQHNLRASLL